MRERPRIGREKKMVPEHGAEYKSYVSTKQFSNQDFPGSNVKSALYMVESMPEGVHESLRRELQHRLDKAKKTFHQGLLKAHSQQPERFLFYCSQIVGDEQFQKFADEHAELNGDSPEEFQNSLIALLQTNDNLAPEQGTVLENMVLAYLREQERMQERFLEMAKEVRGRVFSVIENLNNRGSIHVDIAEVKRTLREVPIQFADPFSDNSESGVLGTYNTKRHMITIMPQATTDDFLFKKTLAHEYYHALSGKTIIKDAPAPPENAPDGEETHLQNIASEEYSFDDWDSDVAFVDQTMDSLPNYDVARLGVQHLKQDRHRWMNEAITELLTEWTYPAGEGAADIQDLLGAMEAIIQYTGYPEYSSLFHAILVNGEGGDLTYGKPLRAYFESPTSEDGREGLKHTRYFFKRIAEKYYPQFIVDVDKAIKKLNWKNESAGIALLEEYIQNGNYEKIRNFDVAEIQER